MTNNDLQSLRQQAIQLGDEASRLLESYGRMVGRSAEVPNTAQHRRDTEILHVANTARDALAHYRYVALRDAEPKEPDADSRTLSEYQHEAQKTANYPRPGRTMQLPIYASLKLAGETGEVAEKIGKIMRDRGGVMEKADETALAKELGDVLWYVAAVAADLNLDLGDIAEMNLAKLQDRKSRGVIGGSGDDR